MAMQPYTGASSSSSSSSVVSSKKFDVFISFHGKDTRIKFTSHLYVALSKYFRTFIDEKDLEKGDEISSALVKAIEEAYVSVVVFSKNYASTKWCLNELVKILECKKDQGQIVIPVFYEVDPSDVRYQRGSYGQAFDKHEQDLRQSKDELQKWRNALTEAANIAGRVFKKDSDRIESNFIKDIVKDVLHRKLPFKVNKKIVGIEKKYEEIELLLNIGSADVRTLVLWGMGGIGKTTLAKYAYAKLSFQFERRCLVENVRQKSNKSEGPSALRKVCLYELFDVPLNSRFIETPNLESELEGEKSLIVLDDVATLEQAENLNMCLGPGSRVIVTTRDKQIFSQFNEYEIHEVKPWNKDDSLELFCSNAFGKKYAEVGYEELSKRAIEYCGGNPLALKVLGANFRTKSKEVWESELEKLKEIPNRGIHDMLKLSFDDLDRTQKAIFLDIVCFLNLESVSFDYCKRDYLVVLFNACKFFAVSGIEALLGKALIANRFCGERIEMHDLLVEMGREIVKQESPEDPGSRSRLWDSEDVYDVLKNNEGTKVVEVICFDTSKIEDLYLRSDSFKKMTKLRYLHITCDKWSGCFNVHFRDGRLERLSDVLRHLYWKSFPLESLPSTFCAKNLVLLNMQYSKLKKLWDGIQKLDNLVEINLDHSYDLIEIPDLSMAPNLQIVSLTCCMSLCQLHLSVFTCPKLRELNLHGCKKIKSLKTNIHSKSLQTLYLPYCSSLVEFSVISEEMTALSLYSTAIHEFPSSIWSNSNLTHLNLMECKNLNIVRKKLSSDLGLRSLTNLYLSGCTKINSRNLWFILDGMPSLKDLDLSKCCNLETLPNNIQNNSLLEILKLDECSKLKSLPKLPKSLKQLTAVNCTYLNINMLHGFHFNFGNRNDEGLSDICCCYLPGGQVPCEFDFHTTNASIDIPRIPKSGLCGFIFCIVLSKGFDVGYDKVGCTIYEHGEGTHHDWDEHVDPFSRMWVKTLLLDHVLLCSCRYGNDELVNMGNESGGDHYTLSFDFKYYVLDDEEEWSTEGIKGCGVLPVYGLEHSLRLDGRSSSGVEIVELQSSAQVSDESVEYVFDMDESDIDESAQVSDESDQLFRLLQFLELQSSARMREPPSQAQVSDELQHQAIRAEVGGSSNENEDDRQQLLIPPKKRRRT